MVTGWRAELARRQRLLADVPLITDDINIALDRVAFESKDSFFSNFVLVILLYYGVPRGLRVILIILHLRISRCKKPVD